MRWMIRRFLKGNRGTSVPEYALMLALVVLCCLGALDALSSAMNATLSEVSSSLGPSGGEDIAPPSPTMMAPPDIK